MGFGVETQRLRTGGSQYSFWSVETKRGGELLDTGVTWQKTDSCGLVRQEPRPWKRQPSWQTPAKAETVEKRGKKTGLFSPCLQVHQCLLLTELTLSLEDRYWARSECESKASPRLTHTQ